MSTQETMTMPVGGMHCRNCVNSVRTALSALPGVSEVEVNLEAGQATVRGGGLDAGALRSAIEDLGFDAGEPV